MRSKKFVRVFLRSLSTLNNHMNELSKEHGFMNEPQRKALLNGVRDCLSRYHAIRDTYGELNSPTKRQAGRSSGSSIKEDE